MLNSRIQLFTLELDALGSGSLNQPKILSQEYHHCLIFFSQETVLCEVSIVVDEFRSAYYQ